MTALALPSVVLMSLVGILGFIDGVYFHIWKFRLHERRDSRREHVIHALRASLAVPAIYGLFVVPVSGVWLWAIAGFIVADFFAMVWDLFEEDHSRRDLGGIPRAEYIIHVVATGFHMAACALALASRPLAAWASDTAPADLPAVVMTIGQLAIPTSIALALAHFALLHPRVAALLPAATGRS
ncbi:MAG: hypothetical protein ACAI38_01065 [Myxococcota bacterium]|nr:hypothetical protein [Myxococcota bacterium]